MTPLVSEGMMSNQNSRSTMISRLKSTSLPRLVFVVLPLLAMKGCSASDEELKDLRPNGYKKWRENPKMVVFGDSTSDSGRRFNAPASFDFEDIGVFPWRRLFSANDTEASNTTIIGSVATDHEHQHWQPYYPVVAQSAGSHDGKAEKFRAYLPSPGAVTNGKAWADWLRIPEELNYATSSATMSDIYGNFQICTGYTGEGEEFPTGNLNEQIDSYFNDIAKSNSNETLDYTHLIGLGGNDVFGFFAAVERYQLGELLQTQGAFGGDAYEDPVPFDQLFEIIDGVAQINVVPLITAIITELSAGVQRLLNDGVTGRIAIANIASFRGVPGLVASGVADTLDEIANATNSLVEDLISTNPQLRLVDVFSLFSAIADNPEVFEALGFCEPEGTPDDFPVPLSIPCLQFDFIVDSTAEVMGTQALRAANCQEECALCADSTSPCQSCFLGNPSATVCDDPSSRIFWDDVHFTTDFHLIFGEAIRQCTKDQPNYDRPFVQILCPDV